MAQHKHRVVPVVFAAVQDGSGSLLLLRRKGTGYRDGQYDFPSGHMEPGELPHDAAIRELYEEAGLVASPEDLELFHVYVDEGTSDPPYLGLMYVLPFGKWQGTPTICEPGKCDDIGFFRADSLPVVTLHVRDAIRLLGTKSTVTHSYYKPAR